MPPKSRWPPKFLVMAVSELKVRRGIAMPLVVMNLTWFAKIVITTAFLGQLGELQLAGGMLGFTFANITGFTVLNGQCGAKELICGQAHGAWNFKLLHKTLFMSVLFLLAASSPISFSWLNVDKVLIRFGQQEDISLVAKSYLFYLLPDQVVTSFLCPLKTYLRSQGATILIMFSSTLALAFHVPINILLAKAKGLEGILMAVRITDLMLVILLALYVAITEHGKDQNRKDVGWWEHGVHDWIQLLKLCGPCCLTTCLKWWCYEILVLLTRRLENTRWAVGVLAIGLNFDYLLYSAMLSLATCASARVSNELGANRPHISYRSAYVSLLVSVLPGCISAMLIIWSATTGASCLRGTAKPWLTLYSNLGGFYLLALPLGLVFAFKAGLGLEGLLLGFLFGVVSCLMLLLVFVARIDWDEEARKAQVFASSAQEEQFDGAPPAERENRMAA
ncbi:hypothetical protein ACJRO7_018475 [Eucalyptus globulus]|uniref:Protein DETOXIFICATION n=1 Tax=Eucalyptus globulus TaxID=34317 RepID=A0ABD3KTW6_EUCGL